MANKKDKDSKVEFLKVVYFDEDAAQDYIDITNGGRLDWTTEENKEKIAKIIAEIDAKAQGGFNLFNVIKAALSGEIKADAQGSLSNIVGSTLKNTLLTDYISAASGDSDVKKFGVGGVYAPANSISLYRMYSSYLNIVPKDQLPIDIEKLNDAILGERGYYAMLLLDEKEPKNVLRFNIAGFKNRYHLADLAKMNLVYYGVKVGTCTKEQLSIENEFTVTTSTMQETISVDEIINGSSQEKTSSKELNVYDIVLAGVIRE